MITELANRIKIRKFSLPSFPSKIFVLVHHLWFIFLAIICMVHIYMNYHIPWFNSIQSTFQEMNMNFAKRQTKSLEKKRCIVCSDKHKAKNSARNGQICYVHKCFGIFWNIPVQWNFIIKRSDITKPSYNKVILLVPALYISLFFYPDIMRNLI